MLLIEREVYKKTNKPKPRNLLIFWILHLFIPELGTNSNKTEFNIEAKNLNEMYDYRKMIKNNVLATMAKKNCYI